MADDGKSQASKASSDEDKEPTLGDRAKEVLKDEAAYMARREARSWLYKLFGHDIGRIITRLFR